MMHILYTTRALFRPLPAFAALLVLLAWSPSQTALAQRTFDVNSVGDAPDARPGDGACATSAGACTFRAALMEAVAGAGNATITFRNIPTVGGTAVISAGGSGYMIQDTQGPGRAIHIQGNTAPGWQPDGPPVIVLDGSQIARNQGHSGLQISGSGLEGSTVMALGIVNFPGSGIRLSNVSKVEIRGCTIGLDVNGTRARPNGAYGILLESAVNTKIIGLGSFTNVVSGNTGHGIGIMQGRDNEILGARVGVSADGTKAVGNGGYGIYIRNSTGNKITGSLGDWETIVSGNANGGIIIQGGGIRPEDGNVVENTYVGTDITGTKALGNGDGEGIYIAGRNNVIGPATRGKDSNVISGNSTEGIILFTDARENTIRNNYIGTVDGGTAALGNRNGVQVTNGSENEIRGNVISGNRSWGVSIQGSSTLNVVAGNYVGVGLPSNPQNDYLNLGNGLDGIRVVSTAGAVLTPNIVENNVVGYNKSGIRATSPYTRIRNNYVGADQNAYTFGNTEDGIALAGDNIQVTGNVIGDNAGQGIYVIGASSSLITKNVIGFDGQRDFPNGESGIRIASTSSAAGNNRIGTSTESDANLIGSNPTGIKIVRGTANAHGNAIGINRIYHHGIPVDLGGDGRTPNDFGDSDEGPNRLINFPEFESGTTRYDPSTKKVNVRYMVDCNTTSCKYPLTVMFYVLDTNGRDANNDPIYLGKDTYPASSASAFRNVSFTVPSSGIVDEGDFLYAGVTDADGNSSEYSDREPLGTGNVSAENPAELPDEVTLYANAPNPFGDRTSIKYSLPEPMHVRLSVYDLTGRLVAVLVDGTQAAGMQTVELGLENGLSSGAYFYRLEAGGSVEVRRMTVLR